MEERKITKKEFDEAVKKVIEDMTPSASSDFFRSFAEGLICAIFASNLSKNLFSKQDNENQKED
jgi:hypothetical protein